MTDKKIPCVAVTRPETHGPKLACIYPLKAFSASDEFDGADEGESITLTLKMMTEDEVNNLPDFEGW
jgi:hypothetical protein